MQRRVRISAVAMAVVAAFVTPVLARLPVAAAPALAGTITTVAGSLGEGPATAVAQHPVALAVRGTKLYVADTHPYSSLRPYQRSVVRVVDLVTRVETVLAGCDIDCIGSGGGPATRTPLERPRGLAVDGAGNVYIAQYGRVLRVDGAGTIGKVAGGGILGRGDAGPAVDAQVSAPEGMAFGPDGSLYVADPADDRVRRIRPDGIIETVAGTTAGFNGDGHHATETQLSRPSGVAVAPDGTLYVADLLNHRVRKIDSQGIVSTVAGPDSPDAFDLSPSKVALDGLGRPVFTSGARVFRIEPTGALTRVAGTTPHRFGPEHVTDDLLGDGGPASAALLAHVSDLAFGGPTMFLADWASVHQVDALGVISRVAGNGSLVEGGDGGPATSAQLYMPSLVSVDGKGHVYVSPGARRVSPSGTISTVAEGEPAGVDSQGRLYVTVGRQLRRVDGPGQVTVLAGFVETSRGSEADGIPALEASTGIVGSIAVGPSGDVYFNDERMRIRKIDSAGIVTTVAGSGASVWQAPVDDGLPATAVAIHADAITVDAAGNLYFIDSERRRVRKVDVLGTISTVAGTGALGSAGDGGPATAATFSWSPATGAGIAVDAAGNLFVSDPYAYRVRRIDTDGTITTVAGTGAAGLTGEGTQATSATLMLPQGVAMDREGNLFLADPFASRVRKVAGVGAAVPPQPMVAWGWNASGELGNTSTAHANRPVQVPVFSRAVAAAGGNAHTLALRADGTVWSWGSNGYGQLGVGSNRAAAAPVRVAGAPKAAAVAGGAFHSLAVGADGSVWAWGWNGAGQLGDGTTVDRLSPVRVTGLTGVVAVSAGAFHSLALKRDGSVWAWGWNGLGQLGDGTTLERRLPTQVLGLSSVTSISAGALHSLVARSDGSAYAWGWNGAGQLGDGTTFDRHRPARLLTGIPITKVAAGAYHSLAVTRDRAVLAWGWNAYGQVGDGTTTDRRAPVTVAGLTGTTDVAAGAVHSLAVGSGGVRSWGWNGAGQLGSGTTTDRSLPGPLGDLIAPRWVAAGAVHSLAGV